jgi:hypothetical protein
MRLYFRDRDADPMVDFDLEMPLGIFLVIYIRGYAL